MALQLNYSKLCATQFVFMLMTRKLYSKQPQQIMINLCFALLGLYLVFVLGIDRRHPTALCVIVGFVIHYFLLVSMAWMLVEGVNMYLLFVKVYNVSVSNFMLKASLCAWGKILHAVSEDNPFTSDPFIDLLLIIIGGKICDLIETDLFLHDIVQ